MKKNVVVEKKTTKEGKEYVVMYIDFGYSQLNVSYNIAEIAQYADLKPSTIGTLKAGDKLIVATYELKGV